MASIKEHVLKGGRVSYEIRWRDVAGKWQTATEYDRARAQALKAAAERELAEARSRMKLLGISPDRAGLVNGTFRQVAESWLATLPNPSTKSQHTSRLKVHVYPHIGDRPIAGITPTEVAGVQRHWGTLAPSTRAVVFGTMAAVFATAVDDKLIPDNPCKAKAARKPRLPNRETPDAWPDEWVSSVAGRIRQDLRVFVLLGAFCGLRQGEIFGLSPELDIVETPDGRILRVQRSIKLLGSKPFAGPPKHRMEADKPREVPLPDFVWEELCANGSGSGTIVAVDWDPGDGGPIAQRAIPLLLTTREGGPWSKNYFNTAIWKPALELAGVPTARENGTHALRHWFACKALESGVSLARLSDLLGHRERAFTLEVYGRFEKARQAEVAGIMDTAARSLLGTAQTNEALR